ncbi:MAG: hypothetical protein WC794_05700 [Candidatus Doudnabacteria bacterium]|jgi:hypothetical protein
MSIPSVYINLEDDVSKVVTRLKHNSAKQIVLVCPKRCFLFNDSINLRLLKKQVDMMGKEVFILTMDEKGQLYAKEAGFGLKFLPKSHASSSFSDVRVNKKEPVPKRDELVRATENLFSGAVKEIKHVAQKLAPAKVVSKHVSAESEKSAVEDAVLLPKLGITDNFFPKEVKEKIQHKEKKGKSKKALVGALVLVVLVGLALNFLVLPKATVVVFPKTEPVTRDMEINISSNVKEIDAIKLTMPATKVAESVDLSEKFQSQGKKQVGNKSTGAVVIYNFTKLPINLKSSTTILTAGSKTYTLLNDVSGIKPTLYKNAKTKEVDDSSLSEPVQIVASGGGEDFNLPAGTRLEITNQVFGSKPQFLFAKSSTEITGGTTRYLSTISQEDVDNAKKQLQNKALQEINDKLKGSGLVLTDKAYIFEITQFTTDNAVGTQTSNFSAALQAKVTGLAYNEKDLSDLITARIGQTLSSNKTLKFDDTQPFAVKVKNLDIINELGTLSVHFEGQAVFNVDLPNITPELVGKSQNEVYEILRSKAEIEKVEITLAPSWQKTFPLLVSQIKLNIEQVK